MSFAVVNVATVDRYLGAQAGGAELICPYANIIVLTVSNAAVLAQFGAGIGPPEYEQTEHPLVPGVWTFPRGKQPILDAVRARSLAAGVPAQVSISAF